jgi:hypothetical protein
MKGGEQRESDGGVGLFGCKGRHGPGVASSLARVGASPVSVASAERSDEASTCPTALLDAPFPSDINDHIASDTAISLFTFYSMRRARQGEEMVSVFMRFMARTGGLSNFRPLT